MNDDALNAQYGEYVKIKSRRKSSFLDNMIMKGVHHLMDKSFARKAAPMNESIKEKLKKKFRKG